MEAGLGLSNGASCYASITCFISQVMTQKGGPGGEERPLWYASTRNHLSPPSGYIYISIYLYIYI